MDQQVSAQKLCPSCSHVKLELFNYFNLHFVVDASYMAHFLEPPGDIARPVAPGPKLVQTIEGYE